MPDCAQNLAAGDAPQGGTLPLLRVRLLSGFGASIDDLPLRLANRKARAMLAILAMTPGHAVSRERLSGLLWSDVRDAQARGSLRQAILELRAALAAAGFDGLTADRVAVSLAPGAIEVDAQRLMADVAAGRGLQDVGRSAQMLDGLDGLGGMFDDWLRETRETLVALLTAALERRAGDEGIALASQREAAEALLRLNPLHEEACRVAMRAAASVGETAAALRYYAALYERLGADHDMEPSAATQALVADIKRGVFHGTEPGQRAATRHSPPAGAVHAEVPASAAALSAGVANGSDRLVRPGPAGPAVPTRQRGRMVTAEDAPVVAVLPFRATGGMPQPDYLAEGIVEDIVHLLAGLREPVVISANSTRRFRDVPTEDLTRIALQLGADYLVTGTVRVQGGATRLVVELAEASQGAVLWSRAIEVQQAALFAAQAEIAAGIANALVPYINQAELRVTRRQAPEDLGAYHLLLRARACMFEFTEGPFEEAGRLLARAAARDPDYAPIHAGMIEWRCYRIFQGWSPDREADVRALEAAAATTLRLDPCHSRGLALYGHNRTIIGHHYDEALDLHDRAVASGRNDAETLIWTAPTLAYVGQAETAIARARRAIALSPQDPLLFRYEHFLSIAHYAAGDLEGAARIGLASASRHPNFTSNLRVTVAALAGLGRVAEASPLVERLMALQPALRVGQSLPRYAFRDPALRERHARWLRLAGVPG